MPIRRSPNGARHTRPQPGRDRPEWVVAINRNAWSQSIGIGGRNQPVNRQDVSDLLWIRDEFLDSEQKFGKIIIHGHTPKEWPEIKPNRVNIDTGAFATGRLTCLVIDGDKARFLFTG